MTRRFGQVIKVHGDARERYVELHASPRPEVLEGLRARHITNYSIFLFGEWLFAYFEYTGDDFDADMATPYPGDESWLAEVTPLQDPLPERRPGEWWATMDEVFHLD